MHFTGSNQVDISINIQLFSYSQAAKGKYCKLTFFSFLFFSADQLSDSKSASEREVQHTDNLMLAATAQCM